MRSLPGRDGPGATRRAPSWAQRGAITQRREIPRSVPRLSSTAPTAPEPAAVENKHQPAWCIARPRTRRTTARARARSRSDGVPTSAASSARYLSVASSALRCSISALTATCNSADAGRSRLSAGDTNRPGDRPAVAAYAEHHVYTPDRVKLRTDPDVHLIRTVPNRRLRAMWAVRFCSLGRSAASRWTPPEGLRSRGRAIPWSETGSRRAFV